MTNIVFSNNVKILGKIQGFYTKPQLYREFRFNGHEYYKVINDRRLGTITGTLLKQSKSWVQNVNYDSKQVIVHSWLSDYRYGKRKSINDQWHFDDPNFPNGYPLFNDKFTRNKQILYIASDHPEGVSNTMFCTTDITIQTLSLRPAQLTAGSTPRVYYEGPAQLTAGSTPRVYYEGPTWFEIYKSLNSIQLKDTYVCNDGENY